MRLSKVSESLSFDRPIALLTAIAGGILILISWWQSYPVYLHSAYSEIFFSISPIYWIGLVLSVPSLLVLSFKGSRAQIATAAVLIFLTLKASSYFFYYFSMGPDPFFQSLTDYYFSQGHIATSFQNIYQWPAFFILAKQFELVTGLPSRVYVHGFVLIMGTLIPASVFLLVEKRSVSAGAAVLGFTLLSFYFLNYQYAPQVLAFPLVLLLIVVDFRVRPSGRRSLIQLLLFLAVCFTHAFMAVFYLLYSFSVMFWGRRSHNVPSRTFTFLLLAIYISGLYFYTAFLPTAASTLFRSLLQVSGISEYSTIYQQTTTPTGDTLVQLLSRATVITTAAVSALFLVDMIRRRQFGSKDYALATAGTLYLVAGSVFVILGGRSLQFLAISASLPIGFFAAMRRKLAPILLIGLAVASVSMPMHVSLYSYLFRDPFTVQQVDFVTSHFGTKVPTTTVFMESATMVILLYDLQAKSTPYILVNEFTEPSHRLPLYDYYSITPGLIHNIKDGLTDATIPTGYLTVQNRVVDDGRDQWILNTNY